MLGTRKAAVALLVAAPLLGACQSMFGKSQALRADPQPPSATAGTDYAAAQVAQGRQALDDGQLSAAVAAFRNAKQYPEQAAAASNGLAVAYSQLGRPDLAERYFREAIALAPGERRYQANLQRFYRLNPIELPQTASVAPAAVEKPLAPANAASPVRIVSKNGSPSALTVSRPASRLVRTSANEVRVGTGQPATAVAQARPRPVSVTVGGQPLRANATYPIRVSIAPREVFVGRAAAPARAAARPQVAVRQEYPIRVELKAAK